jgi:Asp-tRNA(Asn)/Glu-tRNA(Gln) amidotransferase A subunit family amidase
MMPDIRLQEASIEALHGAIQGGELTAADLVRGYLARIEAYDKSGPRLNAVLATSANAITRAEELDAAFAETGELVGPLHGVPVAIKDNILTADMPTTIGSVAMDGYCPPDDATVVRRLRAAGAIILAKTTLPDWAISWFPTSSMSEETKNPYALDRNPGGSSTGTGAAVAANLCAVGLGTDCAGSVRVPASSCNLVGVRGTPGLVPRTGTSYLVIPQDTCGPMARTVTDAAKVLDVLVGYDPADRYSVAHAVSRRHRPYVAELDGDALRRGRVGLVTNALGSAEPEMAAVNSIVQRAVEVIEGAGASVVEVTIPELTNRILETSMYARRSRHDIDLFLSELPDSPVRSLREVYEAGQFHPEVNFLHVIMDGPDHPEEDPEYLRQVAARHEFTLAVTNLMVTNDLDVLVYPSVQVPPPTKDERQKWTGETFPTNTYIASHTWMPAVTVPAGFTDEGAPVGLEFVAKPYDEAAVFRYGFAFEQATNHRRAPGSCPDLAELEGTAPR